MIRTTWSIKLKDVTKTAGDDDGLDRAPGFELDAESINYKASPHDELQILKSTFAEATEHTSHVFGIVSRLQKKAGDDQDLTELFKEARALKRNMTRLGSRMAECFTDLEGSLIEQQRRMSELETSATTDSLTGLRNRLYFNVAMAEMVPAAHKENEDLCVIAFDLDHFKRVNDTYGHDMGDAVLQAFAVALRGELRGKDLVARLGGEEFFAVLPETDIESALVLAENVRRRVEHMHHRSFVFKNGGYERLVELPDVTVSIGVAEILPDEHPTEIVARADKALYAAKNGGRNRVVEAESKFSVKRPVRRIAPPANTP